MKNVIRESYYDYAGNKVMGEEGFVTRLRVMNGKMTVSVSWLDENDIPVSFGDDTYYRIEYTYDKVGNINREKDYDADGKPVCCAKGYAIVYREYDAYNRVVYEKFYGTDASAIMLEDGSVCHRYEYDENGKLIRTTKYDYYDHEVK